MIDNNNNPILNLFGGDIFDGRHHTITLKRPCIGILYCQRYGSTTNSTTIKNVNVVCDNVYAVDDHVRYPGGGSLVCGSSTYFNLYKCNARINSVGAWCGGIVGSNCTNITNISKCIIKANLGKYAGGICGTMCATVTNITCCHMIGNSGYGSGGICSTFCTVSNITNCHVISDLEYIAGGICGGSNTINSISDCSVKGNILGTNAGGICGYLNGISIISNCSFEGNILGSSAGGICGYSNTISKISNCSSKGNVLGSSAGGICGYSNGISNISNCRVIGNIIGDNSGGIIGQRCLGIVTIDKCFVKGIISNKSGGICGAYYITINTNMTISNCRIYSNNISNNSGGIIGYLYGYTESSGSHTLSIINCKSVGHCDKTSSNILAPLLDSRTRQNININITDCEYSNVINRQFPSDWSLTLSNVKKIKI